MTYAQMAKKLEITLNRHAVRSMVLERASMEKDSLKKVLSDKLVYLKIDCCTRHNSHYLGVNIRYVDSDSGCAITQTLGIRDTDHQSTSDELRYYLESVLEEFGVDTKNTVVIVTDNASNMSKVVEDTNAEQVRINRMDDEARANVMENEARGNIMDDEARERDEEHVNLGANEDLTNDDLDEVHDGWGVRDQADDVDGSNELARRLDEALAAIPEIHHIRCAEHTVQLAINDSMKGEIKRLLARIRKVMKAARRPLIYAYLKRRGYKMAILDIVTRWGTTYLMLKSLDTLKVILKRMAVDEPDLQMPEFCWRQAEELLAIMKVPYEVTKAFQYDSLTAGDFMYLWNRLKFKLHNNDSTIALEMKGEMEEREPSLFVPMVIAAVAVDPKHSFMLDEEQESQAKDVITKLCIRMKNLPASPDSSESSAMIEQMDTQETGIEDEYDQLLRERRSSGDPGTSFMEQEVLSPAQQVKAKIDSAYSEFKLLRVTLESKMKVKSYAEVIKEDYPEALKDVSLLLYALPPTQVSVERIFSMLKLLKSDLRTRLKADILSATIFLRANKCLSPVSG